MGIMSNFRGFIAIDIPTFSKLLEFENKIRNTGADIKLVEPKNIHITLKFLGDMSEGQIDKIQDVIKESVKGIEPFEIKFSDTGVFPNQDYMKVIWIGIQNTDPIIKIANSINEKITMMGFKKDKRPFSAHLTIGRVKTAKNKEKIKQVLKKYQKMDFFSYNVESIKLKKSVLTPNGPIYSDVIVIEL